MGKSTSRKLPSIGRKVLQLAAKNHMTSPKEHVQGRKKQKKVHTRSGGAPKARVRVASNSALRRDRGLELGFLKLEQDRLSKTIMARGQQRANRAQRLRKKL